MDALSIDDEVKYLREENRRLKALVELREDRAELEHYQVQSRNKLLLLYVFTFVILGGSWLYYFASRAEMNRELLDQRVQIQRLKNNPPAQP